VVTVLIKIKGISYLLNALARLRQKREDFILDIVGDGDEKDRFINMAKELNINDNVRFHGMKSKEEVAMFMRNCDFYVQPSFYETFGITFIEAMACGKPVIGTRIPALEEKIGKDAGILVPVRDADALSDAINYMLDNYQNYSPEKISQHIINSYSYETVGKKLNDIYIDIVSDKL
jgi:glycosyltransferase involved in cell wall biosynthesis